MKPIKGYEDRYFITSCGKVWSKLSNRFLNQHIDKYGYMNIVLCKDKAQYNHKVHRLVAESYIPNPENKPCVNHKDEVKTHNYISNLEWATVAENNVYGTRMLKLEKPVICVDNGKVYKSAREAGRITNITSSNIIRCCNGQRKTAGGLHWTYKGR